MKTILAVALLVTAGGAALAQEAGRTLTDPTQFWTGNGSQQTSKTVKDGSAPGKRYVRITSTGQGAKWSASAHYRLQGEVKRGERITVTAAMRATEPTTLNINMQLATAPFTTIGSGNVEVGTEWGTHTVSFDAPADYAAGTSRVVVQVNARPQTVDFGQTSVTATPAR